MSAALTIGLIFVVAAICLFLVWFGIRRRGDLFDPAVLFGVVLSLMYVAKPLYILIEGWYGPGLTESYKYPIDQVALQHALGVAAVGILFLLIGTLVKVDVGSWIGMSPERGSTGLTFLAAGLLASMVAVATVGLLKVAGGLLPLLLGVRARHELYEGRAFWIVLLSWGNLGFLIAEYLWLSGRVNRKWLVPFGFAALLGSVLTGERGTLILGFLAPAVIVFHYVRRPLRTAEAAAGALLGLSLFVGIRVATRDVFAEPGASFSSKIVETVSDLPDYLLGNLELAQFDALVMQVREIPERVPYRYGASVVRMALTFAPSAIFPDKPDRGNIAFTKRFLPQFYAIGKAGVTSSLMGDAYMNFGIIGVAISMFLVGMLGSAAYTLTDRGYWLGPAVYALTITGLVMIIRVDLQQFVTLAESAVPVFALAFIPIFSPRERSAGVEQSAYAKT